MRLIGVLGAVLVVLVATTSCDTTQPLQQTSQMASISIRGGSNLGASNGVTAGVAAVFFQEWYEDADPFNADTEDILGDPFFNCQTITSGTMPGPFSIPMTYSIEVVVIRAGSATRETISSPEAATLAPDLNVTQYTESDAVFENAGAIRIAYDQSGAIRPLNLNEPVPATTSRLFRSRPMRRRLSQADIQVMQATENPLVELGVPPPAANRCSAMFPGPSRTDGKNPFAFGIGKGDTVIVNARRGNPLGGLNLHGGLPVLQASLLIDGQPVTVTGNTVSSTDEGAGISFSFTTR